MLDEEALTAELAAARQTLTEAEASHQAEIKRLAARLADCHLGKEVLRSRLAAAEKVHRELERTRAAVDAYRAIQ